MPCVYALISIITYDWSSSYMVSILPGHFKKIRQTPRVDRISERDVLYKF